MPQPTFAERLEWLLREVPREVGSRRRFSTDDVIAVLASAVPEGGTLELSPSEAAGKWLSEVLAGPQGPTTRGSRVSRRYVAALEDLFRLPARYFDDEEVAARVDERIAFMNSPGTRVMRVLGPCRVSAFEMTADEIHEVHVRLEQVLSGGKHR